MKICQLCTVDFTLYHFLLPLMMAMRDAGHDVVGVCADGRLLGPVRDSGFRVETAPLARSANPLRAIRSFVGLYKLLRRERFAYQYGEWNRSLKSWRLRCWRIFLDQCQELGREADHTMPLVCERFHVIYPR